MQIRDRIKINIYGEKLSVRNACLALFYGVLMQIAASFILGTILDMIPGAADAYMDSVSGLLDYTLKTVLYVCIMAPIIEEFIFRGLLLNVSGLLMPFTFANIVQALLFGIYHGNIVQGIYAFILGMFAGLLVYRMNGLIYSVLFHAGLNAAGLFLIGIIDSNAGTGGKAVLTAVSLVIVAVTYIKCVRCLDINS